LHPKTRNWLKNVILLCECFVFEAGFQRKTGRERMVKRLLAGPWELIKQRFPDRQIYHRSDGQVRYFAVTTEMQVGALAVACGLAIWLTISTVNMILEGRAAPT